MSPADPLTVRFAHRQQDARLRADRLRSRLPELAVLLRRAGARRVILFGSLATGSEPHMGTDVDLAVEGLSEKAVADLTFELEALVAARVDLVRLERAPTRLLARIDHDGRELRADEVRDVAG